MSHSEMYEKSKAALAVCSEIKMINRQAFSS